MDPYEPYYEIVSTVYRTAVILFNAYCYVLWVKPSLPVRERLWRIGAVYAAVMLFLGWMPYEIDSLPAYGFGTLAAFLVMCLLDRSDFGQKVFLALTFFCMRWQAGIIIGDFSNWRLKLLEAWILGLKDHAYLSIFYQLATEEYKYWFYYFVIDCIIDFLLGAALLYGAVRLMRRAYGGGQKRLKGKELLFLCVPSVAGIFAYGIEEFYREAYEGATKKSIYDLKGQSPLMILYCLVCYLTILGMVYVFQRWKQEQEADEQRRLFTMQMKDMQRHIAETERLYGDMRRLRHDMGNHLMTLEELYGRGEYEAAGRYAERLQAQFRDASSDVASGNPVTDAILSGRKKEMEEKGIVFFCNFHYPQKGEVDAFDISIILNNALANAIEAKERDKEGGPPYQVRLSSRLVKNMYIIETANPFAGELRTDGTTGLPVTGKAEEGHGFGLSGIRHAARKYYGDLEIGVEEYGGVRCCVLRVMLQIRLPE